jgi:hypothetical protein
VTLASNGLGAWGTSLYNWMRSRSSFLSHRDCRQMRMENGKHETGNGRPVSAGAGAEPGARLQDRPLRTDESATGHGTVGPLNSESAARCGEMRDPTADTNLIGCTVPSVISESSVGCGTLQDHAADTDLIGCAVPSVISESSAGCGALQDHAADTEMTHGAPPVASVGAILSQLRP